VRSPVPTTHIEGVMIDHRFRQHAALANHHDEFAALVDDRQAFGAADVALGKRRALHQLAKLVAIPLRSAEVADALNDEYSSLAGVPANPMDNSPWDDDIVAGFEI